MATASFNWADYLTVATTLSANADEASQRSAISRAYYSVFHAATLHAKPNGYNEHSHGRLWKMYQADKDVNARRLSVIGNQMKRAREAADYAAEVARLEEVVTSQLASATRFVSVLTLVPPTSPQLLPPSPRKLCPNCGTAL